MAIECPYQCHARDFPTILVSFAFILLGANCAEATTSSSTAEYYSSPPVTHARLGYNKTTTTLRSSLPSTSFWVDAGVKSADEFSKESLSFLQRERRTTKRSLCEDGCNCIKKTHFLAVECDLKKNQVYIFGNKNYIPAEATSLVVKLASKANLRIDENFFKETKVNRISIVGTGNENKIHVEFRSNSSTYSLAPNPEIEISNCHTLILRENAIGGDVKLNIKNCNDVIIFENALYDTKFFGLIEDIKELRIAERAFYKAQGNLRIYRSFIEHLHRFDALFHQIAFYNCTIGNITEKAFDVIQISAIIFDNCRINVINTEAMTEKLFSEHLKITGGYIGVIESQAIFGIGIIELVLSNNHIDVIHSNAIKVTSVNASITNNRILRVGQEWLRISDWTKVIVSNNTFGEYNLMLLDKGNNHSVQCIFEKNLITRAMPGSLNFTHKNCMIREIAFDHVCKCLKYDNWLEELTSRDIRSESYCRIDEQLQFCFNRTQLNVLKYENEVCSESSDTLDCMKQNHLKIIDGEFIKPQEFEPKKTSYFVYIIVGICSLLVLVLVLVCIMCRKTRKSMVHDFEGNTNLSFTNRGRFSKEEKRIINQTMDVVKQNYSNETYQELDNHVQRLLRDDADEPQLVQTIAAIVQILNNCENAGDRFVAFTDILGKLLQPTEDINLDPVYAEPQLQRIYHQIPEGQTDIEHIYSEPQSVQQPLLTNEYATPADRNEATAVYAEPVMNDRGSNIITPYAAVGPKRLATSNTAKRYALPQPSTSHNLPDVLNSSTNSTKKMNNVQKIAASFANDPNFHITRSPNSNRRIPQYTISSKARQPGPSRVDPENNATSQETRSNHSGGSDVTVKIDDLEYADA